jgi:hypothetical protein
VNMWAHDQDARELALAKAQSRPAFGLRKGRPYPSFDAAKAADNETPQQAADRLLLDYQARR